MAEACNNLWPWFSRILDNSMMPSWPGRQAIQLNDSSPAAHNNLANVLTEQRRLDEAGTQYRRALELSILPIRQASLRSGLAYPAAAAISSTDTFLRIPLGSMADSPRDLNGNRSGMEARCMDSACFLYVRPGTRRCPPIHLLRLAHRGARRSGRRRMSAPPCSNSSRSVNGVGKVLAAGDPLPMIDCHLPLTSLPSVFQTNRETIPRETPYLFAQSRPARSLGKGDSVRIARAHGLAWPGPAACATAGIDSAFRFQRFFPSCT